MEDYIESADEDLFDLEDEIYDDDDDDEMMIIDATVMKTVNT